MKIRKRSLSGWLVLAFLFIFLRAPTVKSAPQKKDSGTPENLSEMLVIDGGFLAVNTPEGWERAQGPGLAFFLKKGVSRNKAPVWIYVSEIPIGPEGESKNVEDCIQSDIDSFKERFKQGLTRREDPLELPKTKRSAPVVTFQSGEAHSAFEQVVYVAEAGRALTFVLSAKTSAAFEGAAPVFREFVKSYGGSIAMTPAKKGSD
jgi:hypothetical protein